MSDNTIYNDISFPRTCHSSYFALMHLIYIKLNNKQLTQRQIYVLTSVYAFFNKYLSIKTRQLLITMVTARWKNPVNSNASLEFKSISYTNHILYALVSYHFWEHLWFVALKQNVLKIFARFTFISVTWCWASSTRAKFPFPKRTPSMLYRPIYWIFFPIVVTSSSSTSFL